MVSFFFNFLIKTVKEVMAYKYFKSLIALTFLPALTVIPLIIFSLSIDPLYLYSDVTQKNGFGYLPGSPYLDPYVGTIFQSLGHLSASEWIHGRIPWWNSFSGIGMPLAGEMIPGSFFLPFILFLLIKNGVLIIQISLQIITGIATFFLLRELKIGILASTVGGIVFQFNGTFTWVSGSITGPIPFIPMLLYGIERSRINLPRNNSIIWISISIGFSILSGFPEVSYIGGLFGLLWAIARLYDTENKRLYVKRIIYGGLIGIFFSAPLLVSFIDYLSVSDVFFNHNFGNAKTPLHAIPKIFFPYIYGVDHIPSGGNILSHINDMVAGYISILTFYISLFCFTSKSNLSIKAISSTWLILVFTKAFVVEPISSLLDHVPFILQTGFYRYAAPTWELASTILMAIGLDELRYKKDKALVPIIITFLIVIISLYIGWPKNKYWGWSNDHLKYMIKYFYFSIIYGVITIIMTSLIIKSPVNFKLNALFILLTLNSLILYIVPEFSGIKKGVIDKPAINYLKKNLGLYRFYTLGPIQPNYGGYFELASLNFNAIPISSNWQRYVSNNLFPEFKKTGFILLWPPGYTNSLGIDNFYKYLYNFKDNSVKFLITGKDQDTFPSIFLPTVKGPATNTIVLFPGQEMKELINAPTSPPYFNNEIKSIGVFIGNFNNSSDGSIRIIACSKNICTTGTRSLKGSKDLDYIFVPVYPLLKVLPNDKISIRILHDNGKKPLVIWLWPSNGNSEKIYGPNGVYTDFMSRIGLEYNVMISSMFKKAYSDRIMDIWRIDNPMPYYQIIKGGPCILNNVKRNSLDLMCENTAKLVRRELFMTGWEASISSKTYRIDPYKKIFQEITVKKGTSHIIFTFSPKYIFLGWILCFFSFFLFIYSAFLYFKMPNPVSGRVQKSLLTDDESGIK